MLKVFVSMTARYALSECESISYNIAEYNMLIGSIGLLYSQYLPFASHHIGAFQERVIPSLQYNRFKLFKLNNGTPVGFFHWIWVNEKTLRGIISSQYVNLSDVENGNIPLCLDLLFHPVHSVTITNDLDNNVFEPNTKIFKIDWSSGSPIVR